MYKLLALDLDDTVLDSGGSVPPRVKDAVARAKKAGVAIVIATGRPYRSALRFINELEVDGEVICFAGAMVVNHPGGEIVYKDVLSDADVRDIAAFAKEQGVYCQIFDGDDYHFEVETEHSRRYARGSGYSGKLVRFDEMTFSSAQKVLYVDDDRIPEILEKARRRFGDRFCIAVSKPFFLEINPVSATKGSALMELGRQMGIGAEEMIAVGDSMIDLPMIECAGLGVCVANGLPEIIRAADYVCPSNDEDGVAHVIDKFIFGEC